MKRPRELTQCKGNLPYHPVIVLVDTDTPDDQADYIPLGIVGSYLSESLNLPPVNAIAG